MATTMARSDALSAVQPFVDSVIKSLVSEYEDKLSSKQEYLDRLVREAQDARELNEALSSQCATLRQYVHQSTIEFQQIREKLLRYEQNGVDELKKVETSWRAKDASKTKELDAAQAKIARLESQLKSALAGAPLPAGVEEGHCVIAVEELEALRAHGGGVRNAELQIKLEGKIEQVKSLQDKMARMEATYAEQLAAKSAELQQHLDNATTLRTDFDAIQDNLNKRHPEMDALEEKLADAEMTVADQQVALEAKEEALVELEAQLEQQAAEMEAAQRAAARELREELDAAHAAERAAMEKDWRETIDAMQLQVDTTNEKFVEVREENVKLYNEVQDLKGAIRVYCRVRPLLASDQSDTTCVSVYSKTKEVAVEDPKVGPKMFSFDKVFAEDVSQEGVYEDMQPLMRCVLDGLNVALLAYGQTGSGKTFTMSGPGNAEDAHQRGALSGVNYRALEDLFAIAQQRDGEIEYTFTVQMLEIYNEQIRDLLTPQSDNKALDVRLAIGPTGIKSWHVPDAAMRTVRSSAEVAATMLEGERNRAVGQTNMNERSSRSHSVVTVQVAGRDVRSGTKLSGFLNLVDLAGSERVGRSEATGARLKEAQHINKSLSALGDVINAHANKSSHIPFRNSKLTTLLQDSLGGRAKVCMFVHINPETASSGESLSTLYFAQRAATVTLGGAKVNMESGEVETLTKNLKKAQEDLEQREAEVIKLRQAARSSGGGTHSGASASAKPDSKEQDLRRELMDSRKVQRALEEELKQLTVHKLGMESTMNRMRADLDATKLAKDESAAEVLQLKRDMQKLQVALKQREAENARLSRQSSGQTSPKRVRHNDIKPAVGSVSPVMTAPKARVVRPATATAVRSSLPAGFASMATTRGARPMSANVRSSVQNSMSDSLAGSGQTTPRGENAGTAARLAAARKSLGVTSSGMPSNPASRRQSTQAVGGRWM